MALAGDMTTEPAAPIIFHGRLIKFVPPPPPPHHCLTPLHPHLFGIGSIWECDECQRQWKICETISSGLVWMPGRLPGEGFTCPTG